MMRWNNLISVGLLAFALPVIVNAQEVKTPAASITFNHLTAEGDRAYEANVSHGETISVTIAQTCEALFSYNVRGIIRAEPTEGATRALRGGDLPALADKELTIPHDDQYGGYIISITRMSNAAGCAGAEKLVNRTIIISTPKLEWDLAFSGGFTVSNLSNPVFYLRDHPSVAGKKQVQENEDARDAANLGIATFVHLYHRRLPWLGGMFGLGIREGNQTEYFLGGGLRFNDKATLNFGVALGPVQRLPNGVNTTDPVDDGNVLNELPTRVKRGIFMGITYSFINVRNRLQTPFAGGETDATAPAARARSNEAASCAVTLAPAEVLAPAAGGVVTVRVTPEDETCDWKRTEPEVAWLAVGFPTGTTGPQDMLLTFQPNGGRARPHEVTIGNKTLSITQAGK